MAFSNKIKQLLRRDVLRQTTTLIASTAVSQLLLFLILPLLTRLYTPAQFSSLATYTALIAICSVSAALRFDIAIPLPERDEDAFHLLVIGIVCSLSMTLLFSLIIYVSMQTLSVGEKLKALIPHFWLIPVGIMIATLYAILQAWHIRRKQFSTIANSRFWQAISSGLTQIVLGWLKMGEIGLLLGQILNVGAGIAQLFTKAKKDFYQNNKKISRTKLKALVKEYKSFPKYSSADAIINTAGAHLPIIIIASLAIGDEAGFMLLAMRIVQTPINVVGGALSQVFLSRAPAAYREGNLANETYATIAGVSRVAIGPLVFLGLIAPSIIVPLLGQGWQRAGDLIQWLIPWMILQLLASPISMIMHVCSRQLTMLKLTSIGLVTRCLTIVLAYILMPAHMTEWYAVSSAIFYGLCLAVFLSTIGGNGRTFVIYIKPSFKYVVAWLILSAAVLICIKN